MLRYALMVLVVSSCKPAEEPPRRASVAIEVASSRPELGTPAGAVRVTERVELGDTPPAPPVIGGVTRGELDAVAAVADTMLLDGGPTATDGEVADAPSDSATDAVADGEVVFPVRPEDLPPELLAELALDVPQAARDEARKLNKAGLEAHKKLALDVAQDQYRKALVSFPAFPFARYNLACALALQKRDDEALFHLAVLRYLMDARRDNVSRERLEAARVDADFDLLREDPRFRSLTGVTGVIVSWVAADIDGKKNAQALVKALREARWPARIATSAWAGAVPSNTIRVRGGDPIAEAAAKAIAGVLQAASDDASAASWPIEIGAPLPSEAPPIVVIVSSGGPEPAVAPDTAALPPNEPAEPGDPAVPRVDPIEPTSPVATPGSPPERAPPGAEMPFATFADTLGKRLRSERTVSGGSERHQLELKATGFFAWEVSRPDGVRKRRAGRWSGGETRLALTYKETTETSNPSDPTAAPAITVVEGLTSDLRIELGPHGLMLDGLAFR